MQFVICRSLSLCLSFSVYRCADVHLYSVVVANRHAYLASSHVQGNKTELDEQLRHSCVVSDPQG